MALIRVVAWLTVITLIASLAAPACTSSTTAAGTPCSLNSDCTAGLICALGKCRNQCSNASDCPVAGSSCIDDGRNAACETPTEKNSPCTKESDCRTPLACASDYRCRNLCLSDAECNVLGITGRVCAKDLNGVYYCGDPGEVRNGALDVGPPPGAPTSTPAAEPEGGASAIVAALPQGPIIGSNIGANGGVIGADGVTVSVPAGALTSYVPITIQLSVAPAASGTVSQIFDIGPTGTTFAQPITIAFDYTDSEFGGYPPSDFAVETSASDSGGSWTPLSQIVVDIYAHTITGQTTHLSPYALVQLLPGGAIDSDGSGGSASDAADALRTEDATTDAPFQGVWRDAASASSADGAPRCQDASLSAGLLARYTFASGFDDSSGNGLPATGTNVVAVPGVPTLPGNAYQFDGSTSSIAITGSYALKGARTMCAWVNPNSTAGQPLFVGGVSGTGDFIGIGASGLPCATTANDLLYLDHWGGGVCTTSAGVSVPAHQWDFVCLAWDGLTTVTLYSNGSNAAASQSLYDYDLDTVTIGSSKIGGTSTVKSFDGSIADVEIWTKALTVAQMNELYNGGNGCGNE